MHPRRRPSKHSHRWLVGLFWLVLVTAIGWSVWHVIHNSVNLHSEKITQAIHSSTPTPTPSPVFVPLDVQARWQTVLDTYPTIAVSIELRDIDTGLKAGLHEEVARRAASTAKLIAATDFLTEVEDDQQSLEQTARGATTAQYQLQQMINQSNNDSWQYFLDTLGLQKEQDFAHQQGWTSFNVSTNYLAVDDLADLLQKLWKGQLLSKDHTQLLLSYMQNTNYETLIPPAIPAGAEVWHKYGALEDDLHDASIIKTADGHVYALVIMTNGNGRWAYDERTALFHALVQATFKGVDGS
jgi:beta-lactamase class A